MSNLDFTSEMLLTINHKLDKIRVTLAQITSSGNFTPSDPFTPSAITILEMSIKVLEGRIDNMEAEWKQFKSGCAVDEDADLGD